MIRRETAFSGAKRYADGMLFGTVVQTELRGSYFVIQREHFLQPLVDGVSSVLLRAKPVESAWDT
jgi:hypothetical protein